MSVSGGQIHALIDWDAISSIGVEFDREELSQGKQPVCILTQLMLVFVDQACVTPDGLVEIMECPLTLARSEQRFSLDSLQPVDVLEDFTLGCLGCEVWLTSLDNGQGNNDLLVDVTLLHVILQNVHVCS